MRLPAALALTTALLVVSACGLTSDPPRPPSSAAAVPAMGAPEGWRWVGMDSVVVLVPDAWGKTAASCGDPERERILLIAPRLLDCREREDASSLVIAGVDSAAALELTRTRLRTFRSHGVKGMTTAATCLDAQAGPCRLTFTVPRDDVAFRVSYGGNQPVRLLHRVRHSVQRLPDGYTTVPGIVYGASVNAARAELRLAGLEAELPDVDWPHYATGTEPSAGSVVEIGQVVRVVPGDG